MERADYAAWVTGVAWLCGLVDVDIQLGIEMQVKRLTISPATLSALPSNERALLIVMGHVLNEVNVLSKLFLMAGNFDKEPRVVGHAHVCQALVLARALIGKLYEAWQALQNGYFRSQLSLEYDSTLDSEPADGLARLKRYFGKDNIISTVRNSFAHHYSLVHAAAELPANVPPEELSIYFGGTNGNSLYQFSEYAMGKALLDAIDSDDSQRAFDRMIDETSAVVSWFNNVAQGLVFSILERRANLTGRASELEDVPVGEVPMLSSIRIPYFYDHAEHSPSSDA